MCFRIANWMLPRLGLAWRVWVLDFSLGHGDWYVWDRLVSCRVTLVKKPISSAVNPTPCLGSKQDLIDDKHTSRFGGSPLPNQSGLRDIVKDERHNARTNWKT